MLLGLGVGGKGDFHTYRKGEELSPGRKIGNEQTNVRSETLFSLVAQIIDTLSTLDVVALPWISARLLVSPRGPVT